LTKRSGEFEGLDGGSKSNNIFTTTITSTTTSTRLHNTEEVANKIDNDVSTKSKIAVAKNSSEPSKKDSGEKGILNRAIGRLLEQRQREVDDDADVEDEVDEKAAVVANGKAKVSLNFDSPTKKLKKRSPELSSRRQKRAAANKASDRIARESRGSINLDSSSSASSSDSVSVL
jgi:hypothetical protein